MAEKGMAEKGMAEKGMAEKGAPWSCAPRSWTVGVHVRPPSPSAPRNVHVGVQRVVPAGTPLAIKGTPGAPPAAAAVRAPSPSGAVDEVSAEATTAPAATE